MFAIKDNGVVYLVAPAWKRLCSACSDNEWYLTEENASVWKIPNDDDVIVAVSGCCFVADTLRFESDFFEGELSVERIVTELSPQLREFLDTCGKIPQNDKSSCYIFLAQKDRLFYLKFFQEAYEVDQYDTTDTMLLPALETSKGMPIEERIRFVASIAEASSPGTELPVHVIDTATCKIRLVK